MSNHERILRGIVQSKHQVELPSWELHSYFEYFCAWQVLKTKDVSFGDIQDGLVGKGNDGGIDGFYVFVNDFLLTDEFDPAELKGELRFEIIILQSKYSTSFKESVPDKFCSAFDELFDLDVNLDDLTATYNTELLEKVSLVRDLWQQTLTRVPVVSVRFVYCSLGESSEVHPNVRKKVNRLKKVAQKHLFEDIDFTFDFWGAGELITEHRKQRIEKLELKAKETVVTTETGGYVALIGLKDYFRFITDDQQNLRRYIFESNVRDHEGSVDVNRAIQQSLASKDRGLDFWWLNNGVTIIASKVSHSNKSVIVESPQVVNGLQTSMEIYSYFRNQSGNKQDNRLILVRVIETTHPQNVDQIIRATNSQTRIAAESLRATDEVHRSIEDYFRLHDWYYERRKNFYSNSGMKLDRIVSIKHLAQAVMSVVLKDVDNARGRPTQRLKDNEEYKRIFSDGYPVELYLNSLLVLERVIAFLADPKIAILEDHKANFRFHTAALVLPIYFRKFDLSIEEISKVKVDTIDRWIIGAAIDTVSHEFVAYKVGKKTSISAEKAAKSSEFTTALLTAAKKKIPKIRSNKQFDAISV